MKFFRTAVLFGCMVIAAGLLHLAVYRTNFTLTNVSNVLFVVGIIVFLPSVVALTSAFEVFNGFRYAMRVLISPSFRREYPRYKEYKDEKKGKVNASIFIEALVSSFVLILIAGYLATRV